MNSLPRNTLLTLTISILLAGCGQRSLTVQEKLDLLVPDRAETVPVTGELLVDGSPEKDVWVYLIPKGESLPKDEPPAHKALTKEDGTFAISTYLAGDGAPEGEYVLCAEWKRFKAVGSEWIGPDKLGSKYMDPSSSEFEVLVEGPEVWIPTIELSTNGIAKSASSSTNWGRQSHAATGPRGH